MAERRMFAKTIIDSDAFLDMPVTARLLYYDLSMRADDDGFVNSPKKIMRMIGASQDDLRILALRKFIIPFDSGIVVIKHWRIHNYIRKDTYNKTPYQDELAMLDVDENKAYTMKKSEPSTIRQLPVDEPSTQVRLGKVRLGKDNNNTMSGKPDRAGARLEIVSYLNEKTGKDFRHSTKATVRLIEARLNDGYTVKDFKKVIDNKTAEWKGTEQEQYLRPETLFAPSHFESYLNQRVIKAKPKGTLSQEMTHDYDIHELSRRAKE